MTAFPCVVCGRRVRRTPRRGDKPAGRTRPLQIVCPACRYRIYDYPRACVGVVVTRRDDVLVLTRRHAPRRGYLDLPGGFLEAGEDIEAGARRELREETGLVVGRARPLGTYWDRYFLRGFGYIPTLNFYYLARWRSGEPRAADDAADANWMPLGALARPGLRLAWAHMREVFRDLRGMRRDSRTPPRAARPSRDAGR